jgi:hypothetical protein
LANAGVDQNISEGTEVTLNASGSSDTDGTIVSYLWREGTTILSTSSSFSKSDFSTGTHTVVLTVTDNNGGYASDSVVITVINILNPTHNGVTYGSVVSPFTGKRWLDRNLGASQICTAYNDTACYGDYYQWGRNADGHEKTTSTTTSTLATNVSVVGHGSFILSTQIATNYEWADNIDINGSIRAANWSKTDGSSVCPVGYRVPTMPELNDETINTTDPIVDEVTAFENFLKLPIAGNRYYRLGTVDNQGWNGFMWTTTTNGSTSYFLDFSTYEPYMNSGSRASGHSVRCIMN